MIDFQFRVSMDIRAYGTVNISAETVDAAIEKLTNKYIGRNFAPQGKLESYDTTSPQDIFLFQVSWYGEEDRTGEMRYIDKDLEIDIPNIHLGIGHLTVKETEILIDALSLNHLAEPTDTGKRLLNELKDDYLRIVGTPYG